VTPADRGLALMSLTDAIATRRVVTDDEPAAARIVAALQ
jgi:hypothetical protein